MKSRNPYFDNVKGILIILVFFGHMISPFREQVNMASFLYKFIYSFHMPFFIIISGYFSKKDNPKGMLNLLFILMLAQISYTFLIYGQVIWLDFAFGLWYLASLLTWKSITMYVKNRKILFALAVVMGLIGGFIPFTKFLALARTFRFFIYYVIGYSLSKDNVNVISKRLRKKTSLLLTIMLFFGYIIVMSMFDITWKNHWFAGDRTYTLLLGSYYYLGPIIQLLIYGLSLLTVLLISNVIPQQKIPIINTIGRFTLTFYLGQSFITYYLRYVVEYKTLNLNILTATLIVVLYTFVFFGLQQLKQLQQNKQKEQ